MRRKVKLSSDRVTAARIERVGRRIVAVLGDIGYQWQFFLIEGDQVNAFALPGGHVYFYTGIMKLMENDDQIATVMGHEIAHVLARHGAERMSLQMLNNAGAQVLASALDLPAEYQGLYQTAYGLASNVGVMLPFSRKHEYEADTIGVNLMHLAGYDMNEAVRFWQKMAAQGGGKPPELLSTHPADAHRIENIRKIIRGLASGN
jgi:predicted Zn-dependent protease